MATRQHATEHPVTIAGALAAGTVLSVSDRRDTYR